MATEELLIDVRSATEFASGALISDIAPTVNIEYQSINQLPEIYIARGITVRKNDHISLYCRSGRRSNIALQTLKTLGYENVRDIGGFEDAKRILDKEQVERQLERELAEHGVANGVSGVKEEKDESEGRGIRVKSFQELMDGLKALEE